jgi:hypothetical protein
VTIRVGCLRCRVTGILEEWSSIAFGQGQNPAYSSSGFMFLFLHPIENYTIGTALSVVSVMDGRHIGGSRQSVTQSMGHKFRCNILALAIFIPQNCSILGQINLAE